MTAEQKRLAHLKLDIQITHALLHTVFLLKGKIRQAKGYKNPN
jgi:hypothetical protein